MKNNKKTPKEVCDRINTFLKTPNFSLERRRRYTGVILWHEHTCNAKKSRNIMTMIVAAQHKPRADQICSQNQNICESSKRASVSETWKTCDWTAVNSGKPKFQFHVGRPGETCYVLILYFSYLEPYLLLHFFVLICLMQSADHACMHYGSPMISALQ